MIYQETSCPDPQFYFKAHSNQQEHFIRTLRLHRTRLQELAHALQFKQDQHESSQKELNSLLLQLHNVESQLKEKSHDLQQCESRLKKMGRENDLLKSQLKSVAHKLNNLDSQQARELTKCKEMLVVAEQNAASLKVQSNSKSIALDNVHKINEERGRKIAELQARLKELLPQLCQSQGEVDNLGKQLFEKCQKHDDLSRQFIHFKDIHCKTEHLTKSLQRDNLELSKEVVILKTRLGQACNESKGKEERVLKMEQQMRSVLEQLWMYETEIEGLRAQKGIIQKELKEKKGNQRGLAAYEKMKREMGELRLREVASIEELMRHIC